MKRGRTRHRRRCAPFCRLSTCCHCTLPQHDPHASTCHQPLRDGACCKESSREGRTGQAGGSLNPSSPRALTSVGSRGAGSFFFRIALVAAFGSPLRPQQIAETLPAQSAGRDHAVVRHHPTATASGSRAVHLTPTCQSCQDVPRPSAVPLSKFRRVEVGQADLDPVVGIRRPADAEAVAVTDIANRSGERLPMPCRKASLARIGVGHGGRRQREQGRGKDYPEHGSSLTRGGFRLVCRARTSGRIRQRAKESAIACWPVAI